MRKFNLSYFFFNNMTDTTNITQLPTDPTNGGSMNPISTNSNNNQLMALDNSTIQQIVNGIQKAAASGSTALPSRDIPQNTNDIMNDPISNTNYIPKEQKYDLGSEEDEDNITYKHEQEQKQERSLEYYYELLQIPFLIAILFFLFQLPIVKQLILTNLPFLSKPDGNMNLNGMLFSSILFGAIYFFLGIVILK